MVRNSELIDYQAIEPIDTADILKAKEEPEPGQSRAF
jgi:hypothetical protein